MVHATCTGESDTGCGDKTILGFAQSIRHYVRLTDLAILCIDDKTESTKKNLHFVEGMSVCTLPKGFCDC